MEKPLLSVCLITYNHAAFIRQALESIVMQQVVFPIELIVADDCSNDGTTAIIEKFLSGYKGPSTFLKREKNVGAFNNFNELLQTARGKYVAYMEGDDYWTHPLKLQMQVDFLERNDRIALSSHNTTIDDWGDKYLFNKVKQYTEGPHDAVYSLTDYIIKDFFHSSSIVYRQTMLAPFPDWYRTAFGGDYFFVLLLAMHGDIHFINESLSVYRIHKTGISSYSSRYEIYKNFDGHLKKFDEHSGKKYHQLLERKRFSFQYGFYYYYPKYVPKFWFALTHLIGIFNLDTSVISWWGRFKIFIPTFLLRTKVDLFDRNQK